MGAMDRSTSCSTQTFAYPPSLALLEHTLVVPNASLRLMVRTVFMSPSQRHS